MAVKDQITADLKEAMKARDQVRLDTLRSVISAFTTSALRRVTIRPTTSRWRSCRSWSTGNDSIPSSAKPGGPNWSKKRPASATFCRSTCRSKSRPTKSAPSCRGDREDPGDGRNQGAR